MKHWIVLAFVLGFPVHAAEAPLLVATEGVFRPFNYMERGRLTGFEIELVEAMAKRLGRKVEWKVQPFDSLLIGLNEHRFALVAASHAVTPERAKAVDFLSPHYCTGAVVVSKAGGPLTAKALAGKTAGVPVGTTYHEQLKKLGTLKEIKTYPKDTDGFLNLVSGRIDAWVTDRFLAIEALKLNKDAKLEIGELLFPETIAMAVAKGDAELLKRADEALAAAFKDGTYLKLSKKYFGRDIRCVK